MYFEREIMFLLNGFGCKFGPSRAIRSCTNLEVTRAPIKKLMGAVNEMGHTAHVHARPLVCCSYTLTFSITTPSLLYNRDTF